MVPMPRFPSFEAFNADPYQHGLDRLGARLRRYGETIGERLELDRAAFLPLPPTPYDACDKRPGRVSSLSLVRYKGDDYWCRWPTATVRCRSRAMSMTS